MKLLSSKKRIAMILAVCMILAAAGVLVMGNSYARNINGASYFSAYGIENRYILDFVENATEIKPCNGAVIGNTSEDTAEGSTATDGKVICVQYPTSYTPLFLKLTFPAGSTGAVISSPNGIPARTCYSYNGAEGYLLNGDGAIGIDKGELNITYVLIKFTEGFITHAESEKLMIDFVDGNNRSMQQVVLEIILQGQENITVVSKEVLPKLGKTGSLTWTVGNNLSQEDAKKISYTLTCKKLTEKGYVDYLLRDNLEYKLTVGSSSTVISLTQPEEYKAQAGTYQLIIAQEYTPEERTEKIQLQKVIVPFFVNYR